MNPKLKSTLIYSGIIGGGFCAVYTLASFMGYRSGVTFKAGSSSFDAETVKQYVALALPLLFAIGKAWFGKLSADKQAFASMIVGEILKQLGKLPPMPETEQDAPLSSEVRELKMRQNDLKETVDEHGKAIDELKAKVT